MEGSNDPSLPHDPSLHGESLTRSNQSSKRLEHCPWCNKSFNQHDLLEAHRYSTEPTWNNDIILCEDKIRFHRPSKVLRSSIDRQESRTIEQSAFAIGSGKDRFRKNPSVGFGANQEDFEIHTPLLQSEQNAHEDKHTTPSTVDPSASFLHCGAGQMQRNYEKVHEAVRGDHESEKAGVEILAGQRKPVALSTLYGTRTPRADIFSSIGHRKDSVASKKDDYITYGFKAPQFREEVDKSTERKARLGAIWAQVRHGPGLTSSTTDSPAPSAENITVVRDSYGVASPKSFKTAQSSLASYLTAPSGSRPGWKANPPRTERRTFLSLDGQTTPTHEASYASSEYGKLVECVVEKIVFYLTHVMSCLVVSAAERAGIRRHVGLRLADIINFIPGPSHKEQIDQLVDALVYALETRAVSGIENYGLRDESHRAGLKNDILPWVLQYVSEERDTPGSVLPGEVFSSEWLRYLHGRGILLDKMEELDWSGRGQHVEYLPREANSIPLELENTLGHSQTAVIDSVKCRRIRLARKKISCNRRLRKEDIIIEVEHLLRLQHWHIVRVVGTYTLRNELSILLYPAAQWDLDKYLDDMLDPESMVNGANSSLGLWTDHPRVLALRSFIGCLSNAIWFIHDQNVKHMDIKPKNMLVRRVGVENYKVYVADFGIARAYKSAAATETDSPTSFTRAYAAPEVVIQEKRGLSADIFSLGCVFMEIVATLSSCLPGVRDQRELLLELRKAKSGDGSFHANIDVVLSWYQELVKDGWRRPPNLTSIVLEIIPQMIDSVPELRPAASELREITAYLCCSNCNNGPEPFEAADVPPT